eukprot:SAG11_NODE_37529_length_256_cov_0.993631_1_plen_41_part_10
MCKQIKLYGLPRSVLDYFVPLDFSGLLCTPGKSYCKVLLGT